MSVTIRVIGSLNADLVTVTPRFPEPGETLTATSFTTNPGGKGANQAVACGRLSRTKPEAQVEITPDEEIHVEMIGAVGRQDNYYSSLFKPSLQQAGVDITHIQEVNEEHTGIAVIVVDSSAGGENRILLSPGANYAGMQPTGQVLQLALQSPRPDVIVMQAEIPLETVVEISRTVARQKRELREQRRQGIDGDLDVIFNPAPAPEGGLPADAYEAIDHLIMNETECEIMAPEKLREISEPEERRTQIAEYFHGLGVRFVVVTLGANGAWYSASDVGSKTQGLRQVCHVPAKKVEKVLDTTGAGDTFVGAYAVKIALWRAQRRQCGKQAENLTEEEREYRYSQQIKEAIEWAISASALSVQRQGAMGGIPWRDELR